jgi:hypothetical protein
MSTIVSILKKSKCLTITEKGRQSEGGSGGMEKRWTQRMR